MLTGLRSRHRSPRTLGLLIVIVVPVLIALATIRPGSDSGGRTVTVVVDEAKGLAKVERDVRIRGVNVGRVTTVRRTGDDAELTLVLDENAGPLYADASAQLRPHSGFEGSAFVDLDPGTPERGELATGTIPKSRSGVYVSLDQALRGFDAPRRADLQEITSELAAAMTDGSVSAVRSILEDAPGLIEDTGTVARAVRGPGGTELSAALRDLQATSGALAQHADDLGPLARDTERTLAAISTADGARLDDTLRLLPSTMQAVRTGAAATTRITRSVRRSATELPPVLDEATPMLAAWTPVARDAKPVLDDAPELADLTRLTLGDLQRSSEPVIRLMNPIERAVDDLRLRAMPPLLKKSRLGSPGYRQILTAFTGFTGAMTDYQTIEQNPQGSGRFVKINGDVPNGLLGTLSDLPQLTP